MITSISLGVDALPIDPQQSGNNLGDGSASQPILIDFPPPGTEPSEATVPFFNYNIPPNVQSEGGEINLNTQFISVSSVFVFVFLSSVGCITRNEFT